MISPAASLSRLVGAEFARTYRLEQNEERYEFKRKKILSFILVSRELENFMALGFFQILDAFLFIFTFLPIRAVIAVFRLLFQCILFFRRRDIIISHSQMIDISKVLLICINLFGLWHVDCSMIYHLVKSQSIIKLYIFFNMLEVVDKLMASFGQDILDTLQWSITVTSSHKPRHLAVILLYFTAAAISVFIHAFVMLLQATVLNVAMNANNKTLMGVMISNNFKELKSYVFKKFNRNSLLQISCSDVRERFHYCVMFLIVFVLTMKESGWKEDYTWLLVSHGCLVLLTEVLIDWIKHAFITRFNEFCVDEIYRDYATTLAHDVMSTKLAALSVCDHTETVSHRMGFSPLPMCALTLRVLLSALPASRLAPSLHNLLVFGVAFLVAITLRVVCFLLILARTAAILRDSAVGAAPAIARCSTPAGRHLAAESARVRLYSSSAHSDHQLLDDSLQHEPYHVFREFTPTPQCCHDITQFTDGAVIAHDTALRDCVAAHSDVIDGWQ